MYFLICAVNSYLYDISVTGSVLFHCLPADPDRSQDWDGWQNFVTPRSPVLFEYPGSYNQDLWRWEEVKTTSQQVLNVFPIQINLFEFK